MKFNSVVARVTTLALMLTAALAFPDQLVATLISALPLITLASVVLLAFGIFAAFQAQKQKRKLITIK